MELDEYVRRQQSITSALTTFLLRMLWPFRVVGLTRQAWTHLLRAMYPEIEKARRESAILGREFYDSQREKHVGGKWDIDLPGYRFDWFAEAMEPSRKAVSAEDAADGAIAQAVMRAVKEVENAGRRTILRPISDPDTRKRDRTVKGWARVATGRETCAFCMMLVSRGPVYQSAEDAGVDLDDTSAMELIDEGDTEALNAVMRRWHPGCDCKVVPVFDRKNWEGRDAYLKAEQLWIDATRGYRGRDALNALRRALENGELDPADFAAAA